MRISDWSSDVCSSDLGAPRTARAWMAAATSSLFAQARYSTSNGSRRCSSNSGDCPVQRIGRMRSWRAKSISDAGVSSIAPVERAACAAARAATSAGRPSVDAELRAAAAPHPDAAAVPAPVLALHAARLRQLPDDVDPAPDRDVAAALAAVVRLAAHRLPVVVVADRKSTRLNSSH